MAVHKKNSDKADAAYATVSAPAAPEPPEAVPPLEESAPLSVAGSAEYNSFVDRIRQELGKVSVKFDQLQLTSSSDSNLMVSFDGLRKLTPGETNTAASDGIQVSNEDTTVSISLGDGIQVHDKKNPGHTLISLAGLHINVNDDKAASGEAIDGTLAGTCLNDTHWRFTGASELAEVKFEMTNLDLPAVLAPPADVHETLEERLDAAKTIVDPTAKDKALRTLATDAARAREVEIVKSALGEMIDMDERDAATHDAVLQLARVGLRKEAIEMAKGIADSDIRDQVMTALAGDPNLCHPKK